MNGHDDAMRGLRGPAQELCPDCEEPIAPGEPTEERFHASADPAERSVRHYHIECAARTYVGSLTHLKGECICYGGDTVDHDPPGMTRRQASAAALAYFRKHGFCTKPRVR